MKRAGSLIVIFLLISLYITTLVCAIIGSDFAISMLQASVFGTIFLPVILYAYLYLFKIFNKPEDHRELNKEIANKIEQEEN